MIIGEDFMKRIFYLLCMVSFLTGSTSFAQVSTSGLSNAEGLKTTVYGLGFSAGWASGVGVSFRSHLPSNSSLQAVFGIIKTSNKLSMCIGGEYQYDLVRNKSTRFFVGPAFSYFYSGNGSNEVAGPFRVGAGVGGEFHVQDALHVAVEGVFVFFSDGRVIPLPQIAAHYYFF
jgi:hypothetical protein